MLGKSTSFGTSLVITSFVFCYLSYIVFWSCSRAWKKHKLWYKPSDDFFHILLFMHGHGRGTRLGTCLVEQQCVSCVHTLQHVLVVRWRCPKTSCIRKQRNDAI